MTGSSQVRSPSFATVVLSAALFLFGGASLENFALVVLVGAITGP